MFIHGGYWRALSSKEFSFVACGMVPHGITVAVMNYALCPQVSIADITRQSRAAAVWLASRERQRSGSPVRVFAAGHSAGGQQVGMLLSADRPTAAHANANARTPTPRSLSRAASPSAEYSICGRCSTRGCSRHSSLTMMPPQNKVRCCTSRSALAPLLVSVGGDESDALIGQSQRYHAAWTEAGLDGEYLPAARHQSL